jgi:histidine triad (HIT) family protein
MAECLFCRIVKGEIPCFKVYEDDRVLAFEDINPISEGHTLVIPKGHAENLQEALEPTGVAVLQLNGKGANQVVMHYHLHLIPRLSGSPELPVTAWELQPGDMESIRETAAKIAGAVKQR